MLGLGSFPVKRNGIRTAYECGVKMTNPNRPDLKCPTDSAARSHPHCRKPQSAEDLTAENVKAVAELERAAHAHRTLADRISDRVAGFCGSMTFVWVHVIWFTLWIGNNLMPGGLKFDPFPFTFLTLVVSLEAIFLSTFILISQNVDKRLSDRRNHLDLQVNLLAEQENTKTLAILSRIAAKLGIPVDDDPTISILEQAMRPEKLVEQIEAADIKRTTEKTLDFKK